MEKRRESQFELIRIIAMLLIIASHFASHGIFRVSQNDAYATWRIGTLANKMITIFYSYGGRIGVALFFMISGYFSYGNHKKRKIDNIVLECFFYAVLLVLIAVILYFFNKDVSSGVFFSTVQNSIIPISSGSWWFVTSYVLLNFFSSRINTLIEKSNIRGELLLIAIFGGAWNIIGIETVFYNVLRVPIFYVLGALIKKHKVSINRKPVLYFSAFGSIVLMVLSTIAGTYVLNHFENKSIVRIINTALQNGVFLPLVSVLMFLLLSHFELHSMIINRIGSTTFGIYLIHDSNLGRTIIWDRVINPSKTLFMLTPGNYLILSILVVIGIFTACSIIDFCRIKYCWPQIEKQYTVLREKLINHIRA